jgi:hypothetical protein
MSSSRKTIFALRALAAVIEMAVWPCQPPALWNTVFVAVQELLRDIDDE